jgi:hypothetical protein
MHSSLIAVIFLFGTQVLSVPPPPPREIMGKPVEQVVDIACKALVTQELRLEPHVLCSIEELLEGKDCERGEVLAVGECFQSADGSSDSPDIPDMIYEFAAKQDDETPTEASVDQKSFDSDWCREGFMEALGFAPGKTSYNGDHSAYVKRNSWELR